MEKEIKIQRIEVKNKEQLDRLYNSSALTLLGLDDTDKELQSFAKWIKNLSEIANPLNMYIIKGKLMNEEYGLTEKNRYPDNFPIVCVNLEEIKQPEKIIIPRFKIGGRWFDDVVNNDRERQNIIDGIEDEEEY